MSNPSPHEYSRRGKYGDTNRTSSARSGSSIRSREEYPQKYHSSGTHNDPSHPLRQNISGNDRSIYQAYAYRDRGKERYADTPQEPIAHQGNEGNEGNSETLNQSNFSRGNERNVERGNNVARSSHLERGNESISYGEQQRYFDGSNSYRAKQRYPEPQNGPNSYHGDSYRPRNNKRRYDDYQENSYWPNQSRKRDQYDTSYHSEPRRFQQTLPPRSEAKLSKADIENGIKELERHLESLSGVQPLNEIKVIDSRWGVKAKGFEKVSAPRAKLSGLFPLPGFPRPVDFTKLEGLVKDRLSNSNDILNEASRIDPVDSRVAKTLVISGIESINYLKIVEFFNDYLRMIDFEQSSSNNVHSKRKSKDDKTLIIEFNNSECATIIYSLNGTKLLFNAYKENHVERRELADKFRLQISRPNEYVVQDEATTSEEVQEIVKDSPRKISLVVSPNVSSDDAREHLSTLAPLVGMQYFREKGTKEPLGLIFAEFRSNEEGIIDKLMGLSFVTNAFYSCLPNKKTPIQNGPIDYYTLPKLVNNELVCPRASSNVVQLINAVSIKDLMDDSNVRFLHKDIKDEASQFGTVVSIKIPRPANDFTPGLQQLNIAGLGKIFIEFDDEKSALKAIMELSGRSYNDRTVLATYFDHEDFKRNII
ncbi:RNA recognition motif family protein [Candida parapsilosis]|uniref:RNA recognition motif family protein n=1 Tax=Candida parapsilosis TaxID=5480 RepID=A0A8X7TDD0_CANPA|nr:RNA recognition motif family protein [Candida parapsilosis]KAF6056705.1 RNA recognition motif family protein [Candida parapsilosis]KAF6059640.1 RNA recognition motif family protein [Candida parapsilosis]KAF6068393.1 RNA recognition motif family protein [Candida parapsilosis]